MQLCGQEEEETRVWQIAAASVTPCLLPRRLLESPSKADTGGLSQGLQQGRRGWDTGLSTEEEAAGGGSIPKSPFQRSKARGKGVHKSLEQESRCLETGLGSAAWGAQRGWKEWWVMEILVSKIKGEAVGAVSCEPSEPWEGWREAPALTAPTLFTALRCLASHAGPALGGEGGSLSEVRTPRPGKPPPPGEGGRSFEL